MKTKEQLISNLNNLKDALDAIIADEGNEAIRLGLATYGKQIDLATLALNGEITASEGTPYIKALAREGLTMGDARDLAEALPSASPVRYTLRQWDDVSNNWRVVG